jgi:pimeloyl-ACP methyl ester carboxylesterase
MAWADLSDVRCYYELIGDGEPLLLIPGLGVNCRGWDSAVPELAEHFTLILADNRGTGRSVGRRHPQTLADFCADLVELLDHLQLERAHVLGLSLGGMIAQRLAIDHPGRVDRLVLMSCTDRFSPYLRQVATILAHCVRHFSWGMFQRTVEVLGTAPQFWDGNAEKIEQRIAAKCATTESRSSVVRQLRCLSSSELDERDYRIAAPTLVIAGDQDALIPSCYAKQMADKIPNSQFLLIHGAGHNPLQETPEQVVGPIIQFLNNRSVSPGGAPGASLTGFDAPFSEVAGCL